MKDYSEFQIKRLDALFNEFKACAFEELDTNFKNLFQTLHGIKIFDSIMCELKAMYPISQQELDDWNKNHNDLRLNRKYQDYPKDKNISILLHWCDFLCQNGKSYRMTSLGRLSNPQIPNETEKQQQQNSFKEHVIGKIIFYIKSRLENVQYYFYLLNRYKMRVENFYRDDLNKKYQEADKGKFEATLQNDLRLFLFDQGVEYPFSSVSLPIGYTDIFAPGCKDDILVSEVKILDGDKNYGLRRLKEGMSQLVKYVGEMQVQTGYLIVFNMKNAEIVVKNEGKQDNLIAISNKAFYIIFINMYNKESASKAKPLEMIEYSADEIIQGI